MIADANTTNVSCATESLAGKRLALCGFDDPNARAVGAVLDDAGAFCRHLPADPAVAVAAARSYDAFVVYLSQSAETDLKLLAQTNKPILAVAPHDFLKYQIGAVRMYAVDCLGYPCPPEELLLRASSLMGVRMAGARPEAGAAVAVIADDDPSVRALVRATLASKAIECHLAEDGPAALRIARELRPSVVVLDVNMPHMDGFEVLSSLRNEAATASIRVLMLTGCEQESDIVRAFGLGADDYLVKPFNPMELAVRVRRLIGVMR